jgi:hypothetical protein
MPPDRFETSLFTYNKSRQAAITREIIEITAGAESLQCKSKQSKIYYQPHGNSENGKIIQIIGPVMDVEFQDAATSRPIYNAL